MHNEATRPSLLPGTAAAGFSIRLLELSHMHRVFSKFCQPHEIRDRRDTIQRAVFDERDCELSNSALAPSRGPAPGRFLPRLPDGRKVIGLLSQTDATEPEVEAAVA